MHDEHLTLTIETNLSFRHSIVLPFSVAKYHEMAVTNTKITQQLCQNDSLFLQ